MAHDAELVGISAELDAARKEEHNARFRASGSLELLFDDETDEKDITVDLGQSQS